MLIGVDFPLSFEKRPLNYILAIWKVKDASILFKKPFALPSQKKNRQG